MRILSVLFAFSLLLSIGCKNAPERPDAILDENYEPIVPSNTPPPAANATAEPPQNAQGVWHYICNNGCAGGGGSAVACATCGSTLVHNQAYHTPAGGTPTAAPTAATTNPGATPMGSITNPVVNGVNATPPPTAATPPKAPEPPQNANGVWHYICNNGCAGGGGSAIACATCGSTLAHNSAYHQ